MSTLLEFVPFQKTVCLYCVFEIKATTVRGAEFVGNSCPRCMRPAWSLEEINEFSKVKSFEKKAPQ